MATVFDKLTAIATAIREKLNGTTKLSLDDMATSISQVYDKGHTDGHEAGYTEGEAAGLADGAEAERVRFMNEYTNNNTRTDFSYAYYGTGWNDDTFYLPYVIKPQRANYMFEGSRITKPEEIKKVDFSGCIAFVRVFADSKVTELGVIDASNSVSGFDGLNQTFAMCYLLVKIEKLIFPKTTQSLYGFIECKSLVDITCEGTAYQSINFQWSPLNKPSIISVFSCLDNTVTGQTATFKQTAVDNAFETSEGAADGSTSEEWLTLVESKRNWTVSLV